VKTLAELGGSSHDRAVVAALDDPSPLVSMSAARALTARPWATNVRKIVSRVGRFSEWNSRFLRATLTALGPTAVPELRKVVLDPEQHPRVRAVAVEVLGELADPEAPVLADALLEEHGDVDLVAASLRVIGRSGDRRYLRRVRPLCWHEDPVIRAQAIAALSRLASDSDYELLEDALHDPSPWVALHAARGLRRGNRTAALERLLESGEAPLSGSRAVAQQVLREEA
jgi:HEAT repeat protein